MDRAYTARSSIVTHYIFHEPGSIPGMPGTFAHCIVEIADDGSLTETPLAQQPHLSDGLYLIDDGGYATGSGMEVLQPPEVPLTETPPEPEAEAPALEEAASNVESEPASEAAPEEVPEPPAPESKEGE